jgi:hypothetical protein
MQINLTNFKKWVLQLLPYTIILILISILYTKCESEITNKMSALNAGGKSLQTKKRTACIVKRSFAVHKQAAKETVLSKDIVAKEVSLLKVKQLRK